MEGTHPLWDELAFNFTEENGTLHEQNPSFPNVDTFPSKWILSVTGWVHWEADSEKELNIQEVFLEEVGLRGNTCVGREAIKTGQREKWSDDVAAIATSAIPPMGSLWSWDGPSALS